VHSGPEPERHSFDAKATSAICRKLICPLSRDRRRRQSGCDYVRLQRTNGEPCCSNQKLYDILRKHGASAGTSFRIAARWTTFYRFHKVVKTVGEASAMSVKAGTDLSCGNEYRSLVQAVKNN
jgi:beta-glucosidase